MAGGVVSHESAARLLGIAVARDPDRPMVTVPRHRHETAGPARLHWADVDPDEVIDGVTSPLRTVVDCTCTLPFAEALVVADSALRNGLVGPTELRAAVGRTSRTGRAVALRVAEAADARAESPLESLVRARALEVGLPVTPQARVTDHAFFARVDLACVERRIAIEADSYSHHGHRDGFERDCARYDELAVRGWLVLRFTWRQALYEPDWVRSTLLAARALHTRRRPGLRYRNRHPARPDYARTDGSSARSAREPVERQDLSSIRARQCVVSASSVRRP